jgi:TonB family protein
MAMADQDKKTPPRAGQDQFAGDFSTFALEYEDDNKKLRWSIAIAALLHLILFLIHLPQVIQSEVKQAEKAKVYVVQQIRFKPPPVQQQQQELLKPRAKKIPIPDPTPDEPEPIRVVEEVQQDIDIPIDDALIGIPEGPPPADTDSGPIQVGGDVRPPEKISAPQPQYSEIARKARIQGVVIVQAIIDKQGNVTNVKVLKGLPMGLEEAAVDAIKQWKFKPAMLNGRPVTVYYNLTVNFKLQ